jgi:hypothetical protein
MFVYTVVFILYPRQAVVPHITNPVIWLAPVLPLSPWDPMLPFSRTIIRTVPMLDLLQKADRSPTEGQNHQRVSFQSRIAPFEWGRGEASYREFLAFWSSCHYDVQTTPYYCLCNVKSVRERRRNSWLCLLPLHHARDFPFFETNENLDLWRNKDYSASVKHG